MPKGQEYRRPGPSRDPYLPHLPPTFGKNQLLPVADSTRMLLESIVSKFNAPIWYAFAYGSGVFEQDGYSSMKKPMIDFVFAVNHTLHWHSINMAQFPGHYPLYSRALGSDFVARVQEISLGLWFNTYVPMNNVTIKYGVTTVDNLCSDLLNWDALYLAGRMHKPIRIIKGDPRVRLTQQVNLTSAIRAALLTLPERFSETELFKKITSFSYGGDIQMFLPAENQNKVCNIVQKQGPQFKELYYRLMAGLPGVYWKNHSTLILQDTSPNARLAHLHKLPSGLLTQWTMGGFASPPQHPEEATEYWARLSARPDLATLVQDEIKHIVRYPSAVQTVKGIVSAGVGKSSRYAADKITKWWRASGSGKGQPPSPPSSPESS
ncbi:Mmp37-domain-containing protein [Thelephora terrestris]|uniref:Phosphatidate cytidylyltransferase, mitochondrial n=1 Tax=Thelephora terrestris TaxID=56493 RepID=A0A9P6H6R1_9AGAM|nr:Mmp37-domain-containing protein [Thelephora terrestris]